MAHLLFYLPTDVRATGGAQRYTSRLSAAVARRGHQVTLLAQACAISTPLHFFVPPPDSTCATSALPLRWVMVSPLCARLLAQAWSAYQFRIARPAVAVLYQACLQPVLRRVVQTWQPDFICTTNSGIIYAAEAMSAVARQMGIPYGLIPLVHTAEQGYAGHRYRRLYRLVDRLFTLTRYEADWLIGQGARPEQVVVIGASAAQVAGSGEMPWWDVSSELSLRERLRLPSQTPVVLFVGRTVVSKGYRALLEAMPLVWKELPAVCFVFIGPAGPSWATDSQRYRDDARVCDLGEVDDRLTQQALADCSLLCVPSSEESFGMVYTEAWHYGKPVIAADIPVTRELIGACNGGLLVTPQAEHIAQAILYLLNNEAEARAMGQRGLQQLERVHTWEHVATQFEQVL